ncbi:MAG TPA: hypothetical protein VMS43_07210 [Allosphingosinicella sp.]|nr:hypothetical protein [Allosphingosinicella sp.]
MPRKGDQIAGSDTQMAAFLFGLARGATVAGAAAAAGLKVPTLYYRRKRCAVFARAWREALEAWDADSGGAEAADAADAADAAGGESKNWASAFAGERGEERATIVRWHAGRGPMRKRKRPVEFGRERRQAFLDHFAETCNLEASAAAAGVSPSAVYRVLKTDAAFAEGFEEALKIGYLFLEAEAVRQQREAQKAYRISPKSWGAAQAQSFERSMQLLREYKRGQGRIGQRPTGARLTKWSFDDAFKALEKRLQAFGLRVERGEEAPEED